MNRVVAEQTGATSTKRRPSRRSVLVTLAVLILSALVGRFAWVAFHPATTEFSLPSPGGGPIDITVGPDGNLWFTEYYPNQLGRLQIGRITPSGTITSFPLPASNEQSMDITAGPDGNLWFTEFHASQIGRITSNP